MSREQVKKKIEDLDKKQLALLALFLQQLEETKVPIPKPSYIEAVRKTRNALSGIKGNLSEDIIAGREDRI
jgi:hypothetical protein